MENKQNNRIRKITVRLKPEEYQLIAQKLQSTTCRKMSEYCRKMMLGKPITIKQRNQSLDELMLEFIELRKVLNGIANNFNQAVKRLHTIALHAELRSWVTAYDLDRKIMMNKTEEIKMLINKIADQWLL